MLAAAITAAAVMSVPAIGTGAEDPAVTYDLSEGSVTISTDGTYIITQSDSTATTNNITVEAGVNADITLSGVNIDVSGQDYVCAFKIADNSTGNVTVILAANTENTLKSGMYSASLQKNGGGEDIGTLTITGEGILTATGGGYGAGIGSGDMGNSKNITISGGTVTATGGDWASGIGGGDRGSGSNITISGGVVTATGGNSGAGIGGGYGGNGSNITISGGTVTANGRNGGAGIGNGYGTYDGNNSGIVINGGSVKANSIANAQPTDGNENNVYLLTLSNGNDETIVIDDKVYAPVNHKAADPEDGNLYAYLTGEEHTVKTGDLFHIYVYDNGFTAYDMKIIFVNENDEVIDTVYANNGDDISALAPEIPEKEGYTGAWDTDLGAITESCTVKAVYTEIPDESSEESSDVSSEESSDITSDESSDVTSDSNTESGISDESAGSSDTESVSDSSSDSADSSKADSSASGSSDKNPSTGAAAGAAAVLLIGAGVAVLKKRG